MCGFVGQLVLFHIWFCVLLSISDETLHLQGKHTWRVQNEPVGFQAWKTTPFSACKVFFLYQPHLMELGMLGGDRMQKRKITVVKPDQKYVRKTEHFPYNDQNCTGVLFHNLVESSWISIPCHKPIGQDILCSIPTDTKPNLLVLIAQNESITCPRETVKKSNECFKLTFPADNICLLQRRVPRVLEDITFFEFLFWATSATLPAILSADLTHHITHTKYGTIGKYEIHLKETNNAIQVCHVEGHMSLAGGNLFLCSDNSSISILRLCDGKADCRQFHDELHCECTDDVSHSIQCKYMETGLHIRHCSRFYYQSVRGACLLFWRNNVTSNEISLFEEKSDEDRIGVTQNFGEDES